VPRASTDVAVHDSERLEGVYKRAALDNPALKSASYASPKTKEKQKKKQKKGHPLIWVKERANAEDGAKGRFWEGRFKSQALLDEAAILSAMAYVDLNPIRAGMAETPETSAYTSVAERMAELPEGDERDTGKARAASPDRPPCDSPRETPVGQGPAWCETLPCQPLMPFDATARLSHAIPFAFEEYLELVESTGRCQRPDKRGQIGERVPTLLDRLGIDPEAFIAASSTLMQRFGSAVGTPTSLTAECAARQARHLRGMRAAREVFERRAA